MDQESELRSELAHRTDLLPVDEEQDRDRDHRSGDEPQQARGPVDAQPAEHLDREQRERAAETAPHERVGRDGRVGEHQVHVDDVVEPLHEDDQHPGPHGDAREDLRDPVHARGRRPSEPEEPDRQQERGDHHGRETLLGDDAALLLQLAREARLGDVGDHGGAEHDADEEAQEGQGRDAWVPPAADLLEGDGIGFKEEVEDAVDEGEVDGDEEEDGFK